MAYSNFINHLRQNVMNILRLKQLEIRTGLSKATLYKFIKAGTFPAQKQLGLRSVGWLESDVSAWVESRITKAV